MNTYACGQLIALLVLGNT